MKLTFIYAPTNDLGAALTFYRDTLGWSEAWREGESTVAFELPKTDVQLMVARVSDPPGPMYQVDSVKEFLAGKPNLTMRVQTREIPDGYVVGVEDPSGNVIYIFDQSAAASGS